MTFLVNFFIQFLVAAVVSELTAKKPSSNLKAKGLDAFDFPTVSRDRNIPYVCGDVIVDAPNVTWYGDLDIVPITQRVDTGLFSSERVTVGYEYYLGMELAIAWGEIDELSAVYFGSEEAFSGSVVDNGAGTAFTVDAKELFGGRQNGGGVFAQCVFYSGAYDQVPDPYMSGQVGEAYNHRGVSKVIWQGPTVAGSGLLSESEYIKHMKFRVKRYPTELGSAYPNINGAANPAEVLFEIMTGRQIHLGGFPTAPYIDGSDFDLSNWRSAAQTLYDEGKGISFQWQQDTLIQDIIDDIEEHIGGKVVEDPLTGLLQLKLLRNDYDINTVPSFDESNIVRFNNYSTNSENTLTNEVIATYTKLGDTAKPEPISVQNSGNLFAQNNISTMNLDLSMFTDPAVVQERALSHLHLVSNPLRSGEVVVDRSAWGVKEGSVVKVSYAAYEMVDVPCRVVKVDFGDPVNREMIITFSEDVFGLSEIIYPSPSESSWVDPNEAPVQISAVNFFEVPKRLLNTVTPNQLAVIPAKPSGAVYSFDTYVSLNGGTNYHRVSESSAFAETGTLTTALASDTESELSNGITFSKSELFDTQNNPNAPDSTFDNFIILNGELLAYDYLVDNGDGTFTTNTLHRGLLDTVPTSHQVGDRVVPLSEITLLNSVFSDSADLDVKFLTASWAGFLSLSAAPNNDYVITNREQLPYPPADLRINGLQTIPEPFTGDVTITWKGRDRNNSAIFKQADSEDSVETGVETVIEIRKADDTVLRTINNATSPYVYTLADELADAGSYQSQLKIVAFTHRTSSSELSLQAWLKTIVKIPPS